MRVQSPKPLNASIGPTVHDPAGAFVVGVVWPPGHAVH